MDPPAQLIHLIAKRETHEPGEALNRLLDELMVRYGEAVEAILFYGSCLRSGNPLDGLVDLYVIVNSYQLAHGKWIPTLFNTLLPPNVYYLELPFDEGKLRAKYSIFSLGDLLKGTSKRWFHGYLWGRLAQPVGILYLRDETIGRKVIEALGQAVITFLSRILPRLPARFDAAELWQRGIALNYATELRAEKASRATQVFTHFRQELEARTRAAITAIPYAIKVEAPTPLERYYVRIPFHIRLWSRFAWTLRSFQGKLLSILRLIKAAFTFQGGVDYIVWKLERHTGAHIEVPSKLRKHPLVFGWSFMWRLYRRGVFR